MVYNKFCLGILVLHKTIIMIILIIMIIIIIITIIMEIPHILLERSELVIKILECNF